MGHLRKTAWLALILTSFLSQVSAADDLLSSQLVDEARQWQEKDRDDMAASVWRKLLRSVPQHPEALVNLGLIEARAGNRKEAQSLWTRASQLKAPPARLSELTAALKVSQGPQESTPASKLESSRALDALTIVIRDKPTDVKQSSEALLTSYQTSDAIKQHWASTRRGLEKLVRDNPDDSRYPIALARHLSYRDSTLREAIRQLNALTQRKLGNKETEELWRKALLSLKAKPDDRTFFTTYLTRFPEDQAVKERLLALTQQETALAQAPKTDTRRTATAVIKTPAPATLGKADTQPTSAAMMQSPAQTDVQTPGQDNGVITLASTLQLDPRNPWVRQALARQDQNANPPIGAETALDSRDESSPAQPEALYARATLYSTQKKWWDALATLERIPASARTSTMAAEQRRLWVNAQVLRALQLFKQGRLQQANALMDQAQAASGVDEALLVTVAGGWSDLGQSAKGLRLMRSVVSSNPVKSVATQIKYAQLLLNDQQDAALAAVLSDLATAGRLNAAQQEDVNRVILGYTLRLTESLRESGRYAEAAATISPALQRLDDSRLLLSRARIYQAEGDFSAALALVERVIVREPNDISHRVLAAELSLAAQKTDKAAGHINAALDQAPDHPRVLAVAGRVEKSRGNAAKALDYFERAQARELDKNAFAGAPSNLSLRLLGQEPDSASTPLSTSKASAVNRPGLLPVPEFKPRSERAPTGVDAAPRPVPPRQFPADPTSRAELNDSYLAWAAVPDSGHVAQRAEWRL